MMNWKTFQERSPERIEEAKKKLRGIDLAYLLESHLAKRSSNESR